MGLGHAAVGSMMGGHGSGYGEGSGIGEGGGYGEGGMAPMESGMAPQ